MECLAQENRLQPAGIRLIELAKKTGTWTALKEVDNLVLPLDLQALFEQHPMAWKFWQYFPPSAQRGILE